MAWTFISNRGTNSSKLSGTTVGVAPTATIAVGRILIVRCASDDTTGTGPTHTVSDTSGNTYEQLIYTSGSSDAASSACSIHISKITTQLTTGSTVTLTLGTARVSKVLELTEFSLGAGNTYQSAGTNAAGGSSANPSVMVSGLSLISRLWVGFVAAEGPRTDTFTEDADYSNTITTGTLGNPAVSNINGSGGNRIATQTADTYNPTITSRDWRVVLAAITETGTAAANFEASVTGTATAGPLDLTTEIRMASSVNGTATATATGMVGAGILFEASISAQANAIGRLTVSLIYSAFSDYLENEVIKHIFRTGTFTKPSQLWISLHTDDPGEDATGTEVTGNNYGRAQLDPGDANWRATTGTDALTYNLQNIAFPAPSGDWGVVTHSAIWDAQTTGNMLVYGTLTHPRTVGVGTGPAFSIGSYQVNISLPPDIAFASLAASVSGSATATATFGTIYTQEDFEDGAITAPWSASDGSATVSTERVKNGTYAGKIHYATTGVGHQSRDVWFNYDRGAAGLDHFFVSGWVYLKTPEVGGATGIGRKLLYLWADQSNPTLKWSLILATTDITTPGTQMKMTFTQQNGPIGGGESVYSCSTSPGFSGIACNLVWDTWYFVEMEVQNNTAPSAPFNGEVRVWITPNGGSTELVYDAIHSLNRDSGFNIRRFLVGEQIDTVDEAGNEYRYWDDIAITDYYRGPT